ncbi:MAG: DUF1566 domain-containing protein, partial [Candidatus Omnitrophota bacterium]
MSKKETELSVLKEIRTTLKKRLPEFKIDPKTWEPKFMSGGVRLEKLSDGWVKDNQLGIDWGPTYQKKLSWQEALDQAAKDGYRLPTPEEMSTLINRSKYDPAIIDGAQILEFKVDDWDWTSTPCAGDPGYAWMVSFYRGLVSP